MSRPAFDVLTEPWIPVVRLDASSDELGILSCLEQAHHIREIKDPSPIVEFGLYRLLVAFVLDALVLADRRPEDEHDLRDLIYEGLFDQSLLAKYVEACGDVFDLFHPERPFLQTGEPMKNEVGFAETLLMHVPSGSEAIHWHHLRMGSLVITASEALRALTVMSPFMKQGGRGYSPSINGTSPLYVLPLGRCLFETLVVNLPTRWRANETSPSAAWARGSVPSGRSSPTTVVDGLTWRPRQVRLVPNGEEATLVRELVFQPGLSVDGSDWVDPNLAYLYGDQGPEKVTIRHNRPLWRDAAVLVLLSQEEFRSEHDKISGRRPDVVDCAFRLLRPDESLRMRAYGLRAKQANVFEWIASELTIPAALGRKTRLGPIFDQELQLAESFAVLLRRALLALSPEFEREQGKRPAKRKKWGRRSIRSLADKCERGYWHALESFFHPLVLALGSLDDDAPDDPDLIVAATKGWHEAIRKIALDQFEAGSKDMDTDGDALARVVKARDGLQLDMRRVLS